MSARNKSVLLLVLIFQVCINTFCQQENDVLSVLKEKLTSYTKAFPREEIFTHTDRNEYIAGEESFFSVYVVDRQSMKVSGSRIAYVELWNAFNTPVIQKRILVSNGTGTGNFRLPDTLHTGVYFLRVYTNWMKNFHRDNFFLKEVHVYNLLNDDSVGLEVPLNSSDRIGSGSYFNSGINFTVDRLPKDSMVLHITVDTSKDQNERLYSIIQTCGNICFTGKHQVHGDHLDVSIPGTGLKPGISQITLFNTEGKPVAEKYIYKRYQPKSGITLHTGTNYKLRERINLEVEFTPETSSAFLSVSVAPGIVNLEGLMEYMILGTEFGIRKSDLGGRSLDEMNEEFVDSVLSGRSSNWIDWNYILSENIHDPEFPIEKEYHYLKGRVEGENADSVDYIFICRPGKNAVFQYALPDRDGFFSFPVQIDESMKDYFIMPDKPDDRSRITIESSFDEEHPVNLQSKKHSVSMPSYIPNWSVNYQVRKIYGISEINNNSGGTAVDKNIRFYGKPDHELVMADYISLPLMEEVFYEILPNVSIRKNSTGREIIITDRIDNRPFMAIPCLMIDGVIINDPELIIDLDPELVEKIDVIKEKYFVGRYEFPGIVNVITKKGDFSSVAIPDYITRVSYRVADSASALVFPDYSNKSGNSRIPDYRTTLYWNGAYLKNTNGNTGISFYSSDIRSDYTITVHGITQDGTMFSLNRNIRVQ